MDYTNAADKIGIIQDDCDFDGKEGGEGSQEKRVVSAKNKEMVLHFMNLLFIEISIDNEGEVYSCDCDLVEMRIVKKLENYSISFCSPVHFFGICQNSPSCNMQTLI